jgi:glycerate kinase
VDNPFFGPRGAAYVYAAQKGATKEDIALLDTGLSDFADILVQHGYRDVKEVIGSGAAGGVGGGMFALFNAELTSGVGLFFDLFNLTRAISDADMVITGEGKFDDQSFDGKVVGRISEECGRHGKVCIVVCGLNEVSSSEEEPARCEVYSIMDQAGDVEKAFDNAREYLVEIGTRIAKKAALGHDQ